MQRLVKTAAVIVLAILGHGSTAETTPIAWEDLVDKSAQIYEDPYLDLAYDQLDNLRVIAQESWKLDEGDLSAEDSAAARAKRDAARAELAEQGIDADWLIEQRWVVAERREKAAKAANMQLDGKTLTLAGFAIAAPPEEDGTRIVYLVPERGMCSHMPPPNPNQMVRARLSGDWSPATMHEPVRLTGTLKVEPSQHEFRIVDGIVPMRASFVMTVEQVETLKDMRAQTDTSADWANGIATRLRASGQLQSSQRESSE